MQSESAVTMVGHAIQLSVAPVFLLSGIGAMLAVMTQRLARVVDRARGYEARLPGALGEESASLHRSLATLSLRAKLINRAITFCTATALLVCLVVVTLFMGEFLKFTTAVVVAIFFVGAMSAFFVGLVCFLREIFIATKALRIGPP